MSKKNRGIFESTYLDIKYPINKNISSEYPYQLVEYLKDRYYKNEGKILDIGCGAGEMLRAFKKNNFVVEGTDIFPQTEDFTNEFKFKVGNLEIEELDYDSNSFDFIFSKSVIEHLRSPINILNESYRILKPQGKCVIMTPSWIHTKWGPFYFDFTHISPFTKPSLKDAMKMSGFKNVEVVHFYQLPIIWKYPALKIFSKLISSMPIPYRPFHDIQLWPNNLNKIIRFSNEVMLLGFGSKD